jgi:hypothetical protein
LVKRVLVCANAVGIRHRVTTKLVIIVIAHIQNLII